MCQPECKALDCMQGWKQSRCSIPMTLDGWSHTHFERFLKRRALPAWTDPCFKLIIRKTFLFCFIQAMFLLLKFILKCHYVFYLNAFFFSLEASNNVILDDLIWDVYFKMKEESAKSQRSILAPCLLDSNSFKNACNVNIHIYIFCLSIIYHQSISRYQPQRHTIQLELKSFSF